MIGAREWAGRRVDGSVLYASIKYSFYLQCTHPRFNPISLDYYLNFFFHWMEKRYSTLSDDSLYTGNIPQVVRSTTVQTEWDLEFQAIRLESSLEWGNVLSRRQKRISWNNNKDKRFIRRSFHSLTHESIGQMVSRFPGRLHILFMRACGLTFAKDTSDFVRYESNF